MGIKHILKCVLIGVLAVINVILFIISIYSFLCFFVNIANGDIGPIFKSFMLGFGGLLLGMVVYDCNVILWEDMF